MRPILYILYLLFNFVKQNLKYNLSSAGKQTKNEEKSEKTGGTGGRGGQSATSPVPPGRYDFRETGLLSEVLCKAGGAGVPEGRGGGAVRVAEFETVGLLFAVKLSRREVGAGGADGEARQAARAFLGGDGEKVFERGVVAEADERGGFGAEVGADDAGLEGDGVDPAVAAALLQFAGEEDVAEFCPAVGAERRIVLLALGVGGIEIGAEQIRRDARGLDHRGARGGEFVEEQMRQKELREQIDLEGALEPVLGQRAFLLRAPGVVGEHVDPVVLRQLRRKPDDVGETRVVGEVVGTAEFGGDLRCLIRIAPDEDHAMTLLHKRARR